MTAASISLRPMGREWPISRGDSKHGDHQGQTGYRFKKSEIRVGHCTCSGHERRRAYASLSQSNHASVLDALEHRVDFIFFNDDDVALLRHVLEHFVFPRRQGQTQ